LEERKRKIRGRERERPKKVQDLVLLIVNSVECSISVKEVDVKKINKKHLRLIKKHISTIDLILCSVLLNVKTMISIKVLAIFNQNYVYLLKHCKNHKRK
jgi:hypothetical protein